MLADVQNIFALRIRRQFVIKVSLYISLHLKYVATLPCKMSDE